MGGWAIVAADVLVMASLAQIAGQYVFLLFGADGIGVRPASGWVLLVGIGWIVAMTLICYVGIEVSANFQKALLGIELTMLLVLSVWALVKVGDGTAPVGHLVPSLSWFNPFRIPSASAFINGVLPDAVHLLGLGHHRVGQRGDGGPARVPGRAAVLSTLSSLVTYVLVVLSTQSYAGIGTTGIGLGNPAQPGRRPVGPRPLGLRHLRARQRAHPPAAAHGPELGRRLDPDHHPPHGPDDPVDGRVPGASRRRSPGSTAGSSPPRCRRW